MWLFKLFLKETGMLQAASFYQNGKRASTPSHSYPFFGMSLIHSLPNDHSSSACLSLRNDLPVLSLIVGFSYSTLDFSSVALLSSCNCMCDLFNAFPWQNCKVQKGSLCFFFFNLFFPQNLLQSLCYPELSISTYSSTSFSKESTFLLATSPLRCSIIPQNQWFSILAEDIVLVSKAFINKKNFKILFFEYDEYGLVAKTVHCLTKCVALLS